MTGTPQPNPSYTYYEYGLEHNVVPAGVVDPLSTDSKAWATANIDFETTIYVLNGHRIFSKAYIDEITITTDINTGDEIKTVVRTYPVWTLEEQTLVKSSPERQVFTTDEGTELFVNPPAIGLGTSEAGITDGTAYDYFRVFDQTEFDWLPRNSSNVQDYISNKRFPPEPFNEELRPRVEYNIDACSKLIPDERECVTITYTLTTQYTHFNILGVPFQRTDVLTITQDVCQPTEDWGKKLKAIINRSAYANGYHHMTMYPVNEPRNYNNEGTPRGRSQIEVMDTDGFLVRTECYNDANVLVGRIIEPVYPIHASAELVFLNGEVVSVNILNNGGFYPHNFFVPLKNVVYDNNRGGVPPRIKAHVTPIRRLRGMMIEGRFVEGSLVGGEIERLEVVDGGENLNQDRPPELDFTSFDLSNTVIDYGQSFSYNRLGRTPIIPLQVTTPDD